MIMNNSKWRDETEEGNRRIASKGSCGHHYQVHAVCPAVPDSRKNSLIDWEDGEALFQCSRDNRTHTHLNKIQEIIQILGIDSRILKLKAPVRHGVHLLFSTDWQTNVPVTWIFTPSPSPPHPPLLILFLLPSVPSSSSFLPVHFTLLPSLLHAFPSLFLLFFPLSLSYFLSILHPLPLSTTIFYSPSPPLPHNCHIPPLSQPQPHWTISVTPPHLLFSTSLFILLLHSPIRTMIRPRMKFWNTKLALVSLSAPLWRHHLPLLLSPTSGRNASPPLPQQRYVFSSSSSKWYVCLGVWIIFPDRAGGIPEEGFSVLFFLYQSLSILWIHLSQCVCCLV